MNRRDAEHLDYLQNPANLAWVVNPKRRRRKGRSAAQRAATARMLAANRSRHGHKRHSRRRRRNPSLAGALGFRRRFSVGAPGAFGMIRAASLGGAGAVLVDVGMGYLGRFYAPAALPVNTDGTTNWLYFAAKTGLAVGLGTVGRRFLPAGMGVKMGEGALTVLAYQILRGLMPAGIALGYLNPAPTARPRLAGSGAGGQSLARYLSGSGAGGQSLGKYEDPGESAALRAANIVALSRRR